MWTKAFIQDHDAIPVTPFGFWATSALDDEDLSVELQLHLQTIGKYIQAEDICDYLQDPAVLDQWGLKKPVLLATAKLWMKKLGYRWMRNFRGQYVDGHEWEDVV